MQPKCLNWECEDELVLAAYYKVIYAARGEIAVKVGCSLWFFFKLSALIIVWSWIFEIVHGWLSQSQWVGRSGSSLREAGAGEPVKWVGAGLRIISYGTLFVAKSSICIAPALVVVFLLALKWIKIMFSCILFPLKTLTPIVLIIWHCGAVHLWFICYTSWSCFGAGQRVIGRRVGWAKTGAWRGFTAELWGALAEAAASVASAAGSRDVWGARAWRRRATSAKQAMLAKAARAATARQAAKQRP